MTSGLKYAISLCLLAGCASKPAPVEDSLQQSRQAFYDHLPRPSGWVNDLADVYTEREEHSLDSLIGSYDTSADIVFAVVTLDTMVVAREKFDDIILHIGNTWGVGDKRKNNGIMIGISTGYRRIRINYGKGLVSLISDEKTREIIDQYFIPSFKSGDYYCGTRDGIAHISDLLKANRRRSDH